MCIHYKLTHFKTKNTALKLFKTLTKFKLCCKTHNVTNGFKTLVKTKTKKLLALNFTCVPCILCNNLIKLPLLNCFKLTNTATGQYVRINDCNKMLNSLDQKKSQCYFVNKPKRVYPVCVFKKINIKKLNNVLNCKESSNLCFKPLYKNTLTRTSLATKIIMLKTSTKLEHIQLNSKTCISHAPLTTNKHNAVWKSKSNIYTGQNAKLYQAKWMNSTLSNSTTYCYNKELSKLLLTNYDLAI